MFWEGCVAWLSVLIAAGGSDWAHRILYDWNAPQMSVAAATQTTNPDKAPATHSELNIRTVLRLIVLSSTLHLAGLDVKQAYVCQHLHDWNDGISQVTHDLCCQWKFPLGVTVKEEAYDESPRVEKDMDWKCDWKFLLVNNFLSCIVTHTTI